MKKTLQIGMIMLITISVVLLNGCKKGDTGEPGKDGSSNITARTFSVSSWSSSSSRWYTQLSVPELTLSNINSAAVQAYFGTVSNNWIALPYTHIASTNYFMGYLTTTGLVEVRWDYNGIGIGSDPNSVFGATSQIKIVVIPPAMLASHPDVDLKNYEEVKRTFNLED